MPMRSASSTSSSWRRNNSRWFEFSRGVVVDQMASFIVSPYPGLKRRHAWRPRSHGPRRSGLRQLPYPSGIPAKIRPGRRCSAGQIRLKTPEPDNPGYHTYEKKYQQAFRGYDRGSEDHRRRSNGGHGSQHHKKAYDEAMQGGAFQQE